MPVTVVRSRHNPSSRTAPITKGSFWEANPQRGLDFARETALVMTWPEGVAFEEAFSDCAVTAVIAKDKCRREAVQGLTVVFGELAGLDVDSFRDHDLSRR